MSRRGGKIKVSRNAQVIEAYQDACPYCGGRHTMESIAKLFNITKTRVWQIIKRWG